MIVRVVEQEAKSLGVNIRSLGFTGNKQVQVTRIAKEAEAREWYWNEDRLYFKPYTRVRSEQLFQVGQYGMGKGSDLVYEHDLHWHGTGSFGRFYTGFVAGGHGG